MRRAQPWHLGRRASDKLDEHLLEAARVAARAALGAQASGGAEAQLWAAIAAGTAIETCAKAAVARVSPVLLAEKSRNGEETALLLAGVGEVSKVQALIMRSIGAQEALNLAKRLHPSVRFRKEAEGRVLDVRNAAAHMGYVDTEELGRAVVLMAQVVDDLLRALDEDREAFWGSDLLGSVDRMLDQAASEARKRVALRVATARARLDRRLAGLASGERSPVLAALAAAGTRQPVSLGGRVNRHECPVCHQQGYLHVDVEPGPPVSFSGELIGWPALFDCRVCGLELFGEELDEVPGFPERVELELSDMDLSDYAAEFAPSQGEYEDWEPDEDYLRGR